MADGEITFSTALDNEQLEKELKRAEREIKDLEDKVSKWSGDKSAIEKQMESAEVAIKETEAELEQLKAKMSSFPAITHSAEEAMTNQRAVMHVVAQIEDANKRLETQVTEIDKLSDRWQTADAKVRSYTQQLEGAKSRSGEIGASYSASMKNVSSITQRVTKKAGAFFDSFASKVSGKLKGLFVFSFALGALSSIKSYLVDAAKENDNFAASFANLKATMEGFVAPVINGVTSALTSLMNILTKMFENLASLIDRTLNTNLVGSIQAAREAAKAAEREAKAKKKTAKAAEETAKSIMAFDEINALSANKEEEPDEQPLDWDALGAGQIDATLGKIMLILGAAIMAVGAILCFSGINIPLGITLMAIGALMVYTAVQEQWGQLPAEVQQAITTALVITGMVLLVIGAILAFSMAALPLGIGMMVAGALLLWTAVGINWSAMEPQMQAVVLILMGILGAALLVIGAILVFTGVGTALGLGLMLVGAATLAAVVALAWDSLPKEMQNVVGLVLTLLGGALLVIGAILAFSGAATLLGIGLMIAGAALLAAGTATIDWDSIPQEVRNTVGAILTILGGVLLIIGVILAFSGVALPLGLGMMVVGAALLAVGAVAVDWDSIPPEVRNTVSAILAIVGAALIVFGVILLLTGVGIPLGIGCILAGIGALVGAAAINWDFLQEKCKEIWDSICRWWDSTVAKIFTAEFWAELWKNMVNGLIGAINSGLNAFGDFVNMIAGGVSDILGMFDISWGFNLTMPQLPYLAQGAVIPPNRKFAAVLGDQTSGMNLEAPEGLIRQIVREEAGSSSWDVQQGVAAALLQVLPTIINSDESGDITLILNVNNEELARAVNEGNASLARRGAVKPAISFA